MGLHRRESHPPGARAALRASTREVHERLHAAPAFAAIARGELDRRAYADLLGRLLAFHRAVAPLMACARATIGCSNDNGQAARLARLESDLDHVGRTAGPRVATPAWADDEAVGALYVVEGSTLGGKLIHRQLDVLFAPGERGRSFFGGTSDDGRHWRALCRRLDTHGSCEARLGAMIAGAASAFALFETCLEAAD